MTTKSASAYQSEFNEFRLAYCKAGAILEFFLILGGVALDYFLYPEKFSTLIPVRCFITGLVLLIYAVLHHPYGMQRVRALTLILLALPQIMIAWMIFVTDGTASIYFVGLLLALYATGIILPITFFEGVGFGLFTYLVYFLACYFHPNGLTELGRFVGYSGFILFSGALSGLCTYFNERGRIQVFDLQRQVADKNTELHKTNEALAQIKGHMIQQEKMAALGTLSAGLLHEVNNPVNYSMMALNMALGSPVVKEAADVVESLEDAKEGMQRVQGIVTDLKTFAYQKPNEDTTGRIFLLEKAIKSALRLTSFELKGVEKMVDLPQDTHVRGDEPAVIGVLINLFGNAALALKKAGQQTPKLEIRGQSKGERLHISVRDNGTGIKPENLTRVFEPFFTTRDVGQGLGLGLSVSYGIIQRHGGVLRVASEFGIWTEFSFDLALASPQN